MSTDRERGRVGAYLEEDLVKTNQGETKLEQNKLAKLGDAIAISNLKLSITDPLTGKWVSDPLTGQVGH